MMKTYSLLLLFFFSYLKNTVSQSKDHTVHLNNEIQRFFVGTGDHQGWKMGLGLGYNFNDRLSLDLMFNLWTVTNYGDEPLFKSINGYPTIDIYPENYPFPQIVIPHSELTSYGVKNYTPQNNFWESESLDLYLNYRLVRSEKIYINLGAGTSLIRTDYTYINEEWSGSVFPDWDPETEYKIRFLVPLYVRYIDIGGLINGSMDYRFNDKLFAGINLKSYFYTSSTNFTYGLHVQYKF